MIAVRRATERDVGAMVQVHREAFPEFFLTSLGPRFLSRLYRSIVRDTGTICFVADSDSGMCGFIVGPAEPSRFFRRLLFKEGAGFAIDALPAMLRRPLAITRRLLVAAAYRGDPPSVNEAAALISSIAVLPGFAERGSGGMLVQAFCETAALKGMKYVFLLTDRDDNLAANSFYAKHGFVVESEVVRRDGRVMNRYVCHLGNRKWDHASVSE